MRLIDADYLLGTYQALCSAISCEECRAKYKDGTCKVEHWLKAQPTIEERKKGKWICHNAKEGYLIAKYSCSICDYYSGTKRTNFCPNCGADMRGERKITND